MEWVVAVTDAPTKTSPSFLAQAGRNILFKPSQVLRVQCPKIGGCRIGSRAIQVRQDAGPNRAQRSRPRGSTDMRRSNTREVVGRGYSQHALMLDVGTLAATATHYKDVFLELGNADKVLVRQLDPWTQFLPGHDSILADDFPGARPNCLDGRTGNSKT